MNVEINQHPSFDTLCSFAEGRLADTVTDEIGRHIEFCDACAEEVNKHTVTPESLFFRTDIVGSRKLAATNSTFDDADLNAAVQDGLELLNIIGSGGMGVVYRAWQPAVNRHVAVKLVHIPMPQSDQESSAATERFQREIRALGRVQHPNLARIHTSGVTAEGRLYYSMDLIEGPNLSEIHKALSEDINGDYDRCSWLDAVQSACDYDFDSEAGGGPNSQNYAETVVDIVRQVALAVQCLHRAGIVHRDIKPSNIMISSSGTQATLMDLGLAGLVDQQEIRLTRTGLIAGTLPYISPEQFLGELPSESGDIYNLGAVLWEMLAVKRLFAAGGNASEAELMHRTLREEPSPLSRHRDISRDLDAVVLKCLEKNPKARYQTVLDFINDLDRCQNGHGVSARRRGFLFRLGRSLHRQKRSVTWLILLLTVQAAVAAAFYFQGTNNLPDARSPNSTGDIQSAPAVINDGSLVAHWSGEGVGRIARDESKNGNDGAMIDDVVRAKGVLGNAYSFDGAGDYITFGRASKWNFLHDGSPFTITGYLSRTASNLQGGILSTIDEQSRAELRHGLCLRLDGSGRVAMHVQGAGGKFPLTIGSKTLLPPETFTHFAVTFDGKYCQMYVNNELESATEATGSFVSSMAYDALSLGSIGTTSGPNGEAFAPFEGRIDDIQIYDRAMNSSEIAFLAGQPETTLPGPHPVSIIRAKFFAAGGAEDGTSIDATWSGKGMDSANPSFPATHSAKSGDCFLTASSPNASLHYDLGLPQFFNTLRIWNYHGGIYGRHGNGRGCKQIRLLGSNDADAFDDAAHNSWQLITAFTAARAPADGKMSPYGEEHTFQQDMFRYVRVQIDTNYGGASVGLAELQLMNSNRISD